VRPQVVLCDLVGTVYSTEGMIPGAAEAIAAMQSDGHRIRFLTNTDSKSNATLVAEITRRGIQLAPDEVFSPVSAAIALIGSETDARVLALTTDDVRAELATGLELAAGPPGSITHVVVGDVRETLNYDLLNLAYGALVDGAELVALQREPYFLAGGRRNIDTGAVVVALEFASGKPATVVGKPNPMFISLALQSLGPGVDGDAVWVVGDDRFSDVAAGHAAGVHTVLVRTGKYADQIHISGGPMPEYVIDSLADLPGLLAAMVGRLP